MSRSSRPRQQRTLIRASGLRAFRRALVERALEGRPLDARRRVVIVPTRASAELLRQTIEATAMADGRTAIVLPDLLTRDEWMRRLHQSLPGAPPLLTRTAREVLLTRAARRAAARTRMGGPPFELRPGLIGELLTFFDELTLRQRTVRRFARAIFDELRVERGTDRGSESLIHQAAFMGFAFLGYRRGVDESGGLDEHTLRGRLLTSQPDLPFAHAIVAVADRPSDPRGLWPADFDLLGRLRGCTRIDVVMTEEAHDAGLRERLEEELPGVDEVRQAAVGHRPILVSPVTDDAEAPPCVVSRDREDELRDVVRRIRARAADDGGVLSARTAVVFQRPLPYLYLAESVLADAGVPFQAFDALPLASEPFAALVDVVLAMARTGGTREATIALLRSSLVEFTVGGVVVDGADAAALEHVLVARQSTGDARTYDAEVEHWGGGQTVRDRVDVGRARRAAAAAGEIARELLAFRSAPSASAQLGAITTFIRAHESGRHRVDRSAGDERSRRARAAVLGALADLSTALRLGEVAQEREDVITGWIHHAIEARTFASRGERSGVHLVDAVAARFGEFDHLHLAGLVETDWPERSRRSIFFTSPLLTTLGWPQPSEHSKAEVAAFHDLVASAGSTVTLHAFQLEGDAVVALSPLVRAVRGLTVEVHAPPPATRIFADEVLTAGASAVPVRSPAGASAAGGGETADGRDGWLAFRMLRPPLGERRYQGQVGRRDPIPYKVTAVDTYVQCPFKYFASAILRLPEERDEIAGLTPLERGILMHGLFERFYQRWDAVHGGTITLEAIPQALTLFRQLADEALAGVSPADRALEADRLLGSIVSVGVADRVFEHEAEAGGRIVTRVIEQSLKGTFDFPVLAGFGQRPIAISGKADRIDVFDDGSLRVVDYKLSRPPDKGSIQIAVYAHAAQQEMQARDGRPHPVRDAAYLAFAEDKLATPLAKDPTATALEVVTRASAFAKAVESIESGDFPPRPQKFDLCTWCAYSGVCRKEYRMDVDAAEPV
jgi:ATP-dependent helicase/nuclease subunit B